MQEMLILMEKGTSPTHAFMSVRNFQSVRNYKTFITPYLHTSQNAMVGITFPHNLRFYMANGKPKIQAKYYNKDAWESTNEISCLRS